MQMRFIWNNAHCSAVNCILCAVRMQRIIHLHRFYRNFPQNSKANPKHLLIIPKYQKRVCNRPKLQRLCIFSLSWMYCVYLWDSSWLWCVFIFYLPVFEWFSNAFFNECIAMILMLLVFLLFLCVHGLAVHLFISQLTMCPPPSFILILTIQYFSQCTFIYQPTPVISSPNFTSRNHTYNIIFSMLNFVYFKQFAPLFLAKCLNWFFINDPYILLYVLSLPAVSLFHSVIRLFVAIFCAPIQFVHSDCSVANIAVRHESNDFIYILQPT